MARRPLHIPKEFSRFDKRLRQVISLSAKLNDPAFVLRTDANTLRKMIILHTRRISKVRNFFTGSGIDKAISKSQKSFAFKIGSKPSKKIASEIALNVRRENVNLIKGLMDSVGNNLLNKTLSFKKEVKAMASKDVTGARFRIGNKAVNKSAAFELWESKTKEFGTSETVRLSGRNVKIKTFFRQRATTTATAINNQVTVNEGLANGVMVGKFSVNGTKDSCKVHQGNFVFLSTQSRNTFLKLYGKKIPSAKKWPTVNEVKNDATHMLGPNCKHRVIALKTDRLLAEFSVSVAA